MKTALVLAGLSGDMRDRVRRESAKLFVPDGYLELQPVTDARAYNNPDQLASKAIQALGKYIASLDESTEIAILIAYVNYGEETTGRFIDRFFPFALKCALRPIHLDGVRNKSEIAARLNQYTTYLLRAVKELRERARLIRAATNIQNLTPLLLPLRNFDSAELTNMLRKLFENLSTTSSVPDLLGEEVERFVMFHPWARAFTSPRRCFSNGTLYFQSPGKSRHGFFRHSNRSRHAPECLLNARSRLGGTYDYRFHYDCIPVSGGLAPSYPNCHGDLTAPKETHVNIAPNDYIIE